VAPKVLSSARRPVQAASSGVCALHITPASLLAFGSVDSDGRGVAVSNENLKTPKTLLKNVISHSIILSYRKMSGEKAGWGLESV
jgi:hypothetical protein